MTAANLGQKCKRSKVENLVAVVVNKLKHLKIPSYKQMQCVHWCRYKYFTTIIKTFMSAFSHKVRTGLVPTKHKNVERKSNLFTRRLCALALDLYHNKEIGSEVIWHRLNEKLCAFVLDVVPRSGEIKVQIQIQMLIQTYTKNPPFVSETLCICTGCNAPQWQEERILCPPLYSTWFLYYLKLNILVVTILMKMIMYVYCVHRYTAPSCHNTDQDFIKKKQ